MATAALLRSLRRRDLANSSLSAYRTFTANSKAQLASSLSAPRWTGLARPFSTLPSGNHIIGIDLGTTNSCVSVMEGKFTANTSSSLASSTRWAGIARQFSSKPTANDAAGNSYNSDLENKVNPSVAAYQKGLFVGMPARHREFQRAFSTIADIHNNLTDDGKKVLRPLSPHLPVYTPQTTSTSSILHRISGAYLAGVAFGFHILYLKLGSVCLSYSDLYQFFYYTSKLSQLSLEIAAVAMAYHVINGVRHLVADFSGYLFPKIGRKKLK